MVASAFIIGSIIAIKVKYSPRIKGDFAAMAAGIFFAAIAFSLVRESSKLANIGTMILGFILGAGVYSFINHYNRKRSKSRNYSTGPDRNNKSKYYKNSNNFDDDDDDDDGEKGKTLEKEGGDGYREVNNGRTEIQQDEDQSMNYHRNIT